MSKDIKDYIHYYMGRPYWTSNSQGELNAYTLQYVLGMIKGGKEVQLHLRRIEDMTEEEMKDIWHIIFGRLFFERGTIQFFDISKGNQYKRWVMTAEVDRVGIQWDGRIWADSDLELHKFNQHFVTHYLLSKGFDLFSLIDSGAAIDAKTLQTQQQ